MSLYKVSVIIPSYKPRNYIWDCLDSLKLQTLPKEDYEIILVLNGCSEPWKGEIESFIDRNMIGFNIKLIQTDVPGVSNARNLGIDSAKGEYISFIDDDDFVMLDSGTTVLELARKIPPDKPVRVVTYYYEAAEKIAAGDRSEVFLVGGKMRKGFYTCHGHMAEEMLKEFHAKTCFLGADGVDGKAGLTGYNSLDVPLKQIMIRQSERVVLLCDHTKFGQKAFVHVAPIEEIHTIITDSGTDPNVIQELREKNIEVIVT